jgi:hypothetical protein
LAPVLLNGTGSGADYRHPRAGAAGRALARLLNSRRLARLRHAVFKRLPFPVLRSDVADVVYITWLVDADGARALLPPGLALFERDGKTPFTVLTYRHGHFGPALAGPLRRLFPSPLQSNWRLYLDGAQSGAQSVPLPQAAPARSVWFLENVMDSVLYAAGTRLFSDIMQTQLPARFAHARAGDAWVTAIEPGWKGAPLLRSTVRPAAQAALPPAFEAMFGSWEEAVDMLACQDGALAWSARLDALVLARIDLPVALEEVQPLAPVGTPECSLLKRLAPAGEPLSFLVARVPFSVLDERVLRAP